MLSAIQKHEMILTRQAWQQVVLFMASSFA
jgi:hypothetical protein